MTDKEIKALLEENNKELLHSMQIIIENVVNPQFNLLAENQDILKERIDNLERKIDSLEDKVLEHEFKLRIIK